ncbi:hypothetical protein [Phormidium sp. FACHB-1136]|uniref:hypothetical protein n=1 Tax=Phormidium sp. FACHB-1136 TaxID=2692848 RepID=UPI0016859F02|nr:hypothetical protein [Phormidium sp. FACHB-1136]MBD2427677.1 hypothetical protein [Phormidium sp. FACHB-1136]
MATAVSEKVKADWKKAQQSGGHRASRIRAIVSQAATEAFSEIKGGSSELETLGRQSLAEMMAQLQTQAATGAPVTASTATGAPDVIEANTEVQAVVPVPTPAKAAAPTWAELFATVINLVKTRKTDWGQALLTRLQAQLERFDVDMEAEYGARYRLFQPFVWGLRRVVALGLDRLSEPASSPTAPATPVTIEVLDDTDD